MTPAGAHIAGQRTRDRAQPAQSWHEDIRIAAVLPAIAIMCGAGCAQIPSTPMIAPPAVEQSSKTAAVEALVKYVRDQRATGFIVMRGEDILIEEHWPPPDDPRFALFDHGTSDDGQTLEDVASLQKSVVAVLVAIAVEKGLIDLDAPVTAYVGEGWSRAPAEREAAIHVEHLMTMSSGLDEQLRYEVPAGSGFFYNTPAYAILKSVLSAVTGRPIEDVTRDWLTAPAGMADTGWRPRPAAFGNVGNPTGLVTTARDLVTFGRIILLQGCAPNGTSIVSPDALQLLFARSTTNPSYGRLWWLNGGRYTLRPMGRRSEGPLITAAPSDLVAALGFLDRRVYAAPSLDMVVVRTGAATPDSDFDEALWRHLQAILP